MRHERDAAVVSALRLVTLFVEYCNDRVFPLLWDFPLAPDEGGESVELQQDGPILLESEFQQFLHLFGSSLRTIWEEHLLHFIYEAWQDGCKHQQ